MLFITKFSHQHAAITWCCVIYLTKLTRHILPKFPKGIFFKKKKKKEAVPLWCNGIGSGVSGALGYRFEPQLRIWHCRSCGLDLTPGPETPYVAGWPKEAKKKNGKGDSHPLFAQP